MGYGLLIADFQLLTLTHHLPSNVNYYYSSTY